MAVIEKIRQRSTLVVTVIGVALVTFLVTDAINSNLSIFNSSNNMVGEIAGKKINYQEFAEKVDLMTKNMEAQGQVVDEMTSQMIREQVWNEFIQQEVINSQFEKLGLKVTPKELYSVLTNPVDFPQLRDADVFKNQQTGMFDGNLVLAYIKNLDNDQTGEAKRQWVNYENNVVIPQVIQKKYNTIIRNGIFKTSLDVENDYAANYIMADAKVVGFNFNSVMDSSVKVTEDEMKAYLKAHPEEYQQEASRKIEYVVFEVKATAEDTTKTLDAVAKLKESFQNTKNDTLFVENNSDEGFFDTTYKTRGTFPDEAEAQIYSGVVGQVYGPYFKDGKFSLYKALGFKNDTLPYVKASQIVIKPTGIAREDSLQAVVRANAIAARIRAGADFAQMAKDSSNDYSTASNGGSLGWIRKSGGRLPEVVERSVYSASTGSILVVRSNLGVHIIKIEKGPEYQMAAVAEISRTVEYSSATTNSVYEKAFQFASNSRDAASFAENAEKSALIKRISPDLKEGESALPNIQNAREVIRWAFNDETEVGEVSQVISVGDLYIVAQLVSVKEKGLAKLEDVRDRLENDTRLQKKTDLLKERIQKAMGENKTIEQIALELGAIVNASPNTMFSNPNIPFVGADPILTGAILGSPEGKLVGPIRTNNGVYIYTVNKITKNQFPTGDAVNADRNRLAMEAGNEGMNRAFQALKDAADIKDYRYKFY